MDVNVRAILGINEAVCDMDYVNAIIGACAGDVNILKDALGTLKKSQLKRMYAHITHKDEDDMTCETNVSDAAAIIGSPVLNGTENSEDDNDEIENE